MWYTGGKPVKKDICILRDIDSFSSVTDENLINKFSYRYQVVEKAIQESNRFISKALNIPLASKILYLQKVGITEGEPKTIEKVYIDYNKVPGIEKLDLDEESFYSILKREYGIEINQSEEEILVVDANEKEIEILNLKEDSEILLIKGTTYTNDHEPLEYFEIVSVTDFYKFRSVTDLR